jgi:hypothetical protein
MITGLCLLPIHSVLVSPPKGLSLPPRAKYHVHLHKFSLEQTLI